MRYQDGITLLLFLGYNFTREDHSISILALQPYEGSVSSFESSTDVIYAVNSHVAVNCYCTHI